MKEYCENPLCENTAVKEVSVSVRTPADQARALCATCEEAYTWGVQHGKMTVREARVWILAVADRGIIAHARAYNNKAEAEAGLVKYLRKYECYEGDDVDAAFKWLDEHDERLSVEIIQQNMSSNLSET